MIDSRQIRSNLSVAFLAQGLSMLLSVIQTLLIPKVLGVEQYSWWQLYLFYTGYVGFFHFGLSSGIYLEMGGISRDEINKASVKAQFLFGVLFQTIISIAIIIAAQSFIPESERSFVVSMAASCIVLANAATFMMNIFECMNETKRSSVSTIVGRLAFFVPLIILLIQHSTNFKFYVLSYTASTAVQVAYCIHYLHDFMQADWLGLREAARLGISSIKTGISLMLANIASMFILGSARFIIDMRWGIKEFGRLSLALSLVSFFLVFVNQAGLVLFPALRQAGNNEVASFYVKARDALSVAFPAVYVLFFPMAWILEIWLPAYADTLPYLALLLPICVFDSKMSITGITYFNVLRKERQMLVLNACVALFSLVISLICAYYFNSITAVIFGMVVAIAGRSVIAEIYLSHELEVDTTTLSFWEIVLTIIFMFVSNTLPAASALSIYAAAYIIFLIVNQEIVLRLGRRIA